MSAIKIKIIYSLFGIAVILVALNIFIKYQKEKDAETQLKSTAQIEKLQKKVSLQTEEKFKEILLQRNFKDEWIARFITGKKGNTKIIYQISVPRDLTTNQLLVDFNNKLASDSVKLRSSELLAKNKVLLEVYKNKSLLFEAYFKKNNKLERSKKYISFIVEMGVLNENFEDDFNFPNDITYLINVSTNNSVRITDRYDFAIILNDLIIEQKYLLKNSVDKNQIKKSVRNILFSFGKSTPMFVDEKSKLFQSVKFYYIQDYLKENGIAIKNINSIKSLKENDIKGNEALINLKLLNENASAFLLTQKTLSEMNDFIIKLKKKGVELITYKKFLEITSAN